MTEMDDNAESSIYRELREVRASWEETNREIRGLLGWLSKPQPLDDAARAALDADIERSLDKSYPDRRKGVVYRDVLGEWDDARVLEFAADGVDRPDEGGTTLLSAIAETERVELCGALLDRGANPDIGSHGCGDAMEDCVYAGGKAAVPMLDRMLQHSRYGIHDQHKSGMTLLHLAVAERRWDVIRYLMGRGAELSEMDIDCETVEEYAREEGGEAYVRELREVEEGLRGGGATAGGAARKMDDSS